jgi:hypothetical protein
VTVNADDLQSVGDVIRLFEWFRHNQIVHEGL